MSVCLGWDIGGANLKAVALDAEGGVRAAERPFEIWRSPSRLAAALSKMAAGLCGDSGTPRHHAVTMTAELADCFATKREGVRIVLESLSSAFPDEPLRVFTTEEAFVSPAEAARAPLSVAGANWCASAYWLASGLDPGIVAGVLVDVGSTTTDVVPFGRGRLLARGRTDPQRLLADELVYTGALRTPLCAILRRAPLRGCECPVAAEHFAIAADAHLWLGDLDGAAYTCSTPDGGPATREGAAARLARVVCADLDMLSEEDVTAIARRAADAQVEAIARALGRVAERLAAGTPSRGDDAVASPRGAEVSVRVLTAGSGAWLGEEAARRSGLPAEPLAVRLGGLARVLPAYAVARLAPAWSPGTDGRPC